MNKEELIKLGLIGEQKIKLIVGIWFHKVGLMNLLRKRIS